MILHLLIELIINGWPQVDFCCAKIDEWNMNSCIPKFKHLGKTVSKVGWWTRGRERVGDEKKELRYVMNINQLSMINVDNIYCKHALIKIN